MRGWDSVTSYSCMSLCLTKARNEGMHYYYSFLPNRGIENNYKRPILPASKTHHYIQVSGTDSFDLGKVDWKIV